MVGMEYALSVYVVFRFGSLSRLRAVLVFGTAVGCGEKFWN